MCYKYVHRLHTTRERLRHRKRYGYRNGNRHGYRNGYRHRNRHRNGKGYRYHGTREPSYNQTPAYINPKPCN